MKDIRAKLTVPDPENNDILKVDGKSNDLLLPLKKFKGIIQDFKRKNP